MSILNDFFSHLSALTGGAPDHLKMIFTLIASYPTALIYKNLPNNPNLKHSFSIVFAIIVLFGVFDLADAFYIMIMDSLVAYTIMYFVKGALGPRLVLLFALGHLSVNHIYRQINQLSYDNYDPTGPQMVLVIKLTSFAFNVFDGRRPSKQLTPYQKSKAITSMPSMLEYFGYIFFFSAFMVGPAFEFMDYYRFTNMEMFRIDDDSTESDKNAINKKNVKIKKQLKQLKLVNQYYHNDRDKSARYYVPGGFIPAMGKLGLGVFFILCYVMFGGKYPIDWTLSEEFQSISFLDKILYIQIASLCARFKYYIVWLIAEGGCILVGIGFNGYDEHGNAKWDRVSNIDVVAYETADNIKTLLEAWNMNTNKWLKNYVYLRITPHGQKPNFFSTLATFGTSAIWHGFYPGYYLTFATGAFVQGIHRILRRQIRPIFLTSEFSSLKPLYNFLGWLFTQTMIHYVVIPFNILSLRGSLHVWRSLYFSGHITIVLINVAFWLGFNRVCKKLVRIGGGIDTDKELKETKEQIRMQKAERKEFGGGEKVAITESGIPLEVEDGLMNLKKEE